MRLEPEREQTDGGGCGEERQRVPDVSTLDRPPLPPHQPQKYQRHGRHGRLAQQRQQEGGQREPIPAPLKAESRGLRAVGWVSGQSRRATGGTEPQVPQEAQEVEEHRQRVLPLANPGDRLHVDRMHGEQRCRQPGPRNVQPLQHLPQHDGTERVQEHVDHVVAQRVGAPQPPFHPQRGRGHGVVVHGLGRKPESV